MERTEKLAVLLYSITVLGHIQKNRKHSENMDYLISLSSDTQQSIIQQEKNDTKTLRIIIPSCESKYCYSVACQTGSLSNHVFAMLPIFLAALFTSNSLYNR